MPSLQKVIDAIDMIDKQHLDIRTITMGISAARLRERGRRALLRKDLR